MNRRLRLLPRPSPWDEPQQDDASTRAIPKMSFEEMQQMADAAQPSEPPPFETLGAPAEPEASPWDEAPAAFGGETRAFPRMSFEEMEQMASASAPSEPAWAPPTDPFAAEPREQRRSRRSLPRRRRKQSRRRPSTARSPTTSSIRRSRDDVNSQITEDVNSQITDVVRSIRRSPISPRIRSTASRAASCS